MLFLFLYSYGNISNVPEKNNLDAVSEELEKFIKEFLENSVSFSYNKNFSEGFINKIYTGIPYSEHNKTKQQLEKLFSNFTNLISKENLPTKTLLKPVCTSISLFFLEFSKSGQKNFIRLKQLSDEFIQIYKELDKKTLNADILSCLNVIENFLILLDTVVVTPYNTFTRASHYWKTKKDALNWMIITNYLTEKPIIYDTDLYSNAKNIFKKLSNAMLEPSDFENDYKEEYSNLVLEKEIINTTDFDLLTIFFEELHKKILPLNSFDLMLFISQESLVSVYKQTPPTVKDSKDPITDFLIHAKNIFSFDYFKKNENIYTITYANNKKFELTIKINNPEIKTSAKLCSNKKNYSISLEEDLSHLVVFLHEFAHIHYHFNSTLNHDQLMGSPLHELIPLFIESFVKEQTIRNTYASLKVVTFLYHLKKFIHTEQSFAEAYKGTFSKEQQKLLTIMAEEDPTFYSKLKKRTLFNINFIIQDNYLSYLIAKILCAYCKEHRPEININDIQREANSLQNILNYLNISIEKLAEYTFAHFSKNYSHL